MIKSLFTLCLTLLLFSSIGCSPKDIEQLKNNTPLTIKGKLTIVGNEPFTQFAITSKKYDYTLPLIIRENKTVETLQKKIGKNVNLSGKLHIETKTTIKEKKSINFYYLVVEKIKR